ncbi:aspartate aminotransferase family protein [Porticoccaceae bacterium]|nr:aspartate aminotransferase family protein [Porticoccaceae bacterium]
MEKFEKINVTELRDKAADHIWIPFLPVAEHKNSNYVNIWASGEGCRITDIEGRSYLDGFSGLMYKAVGYGRKEIVDAAFNQMLELESSAQFDVATIPAIELAARLAKITPGELSRTFFVCGGSEANEVAVKTAKHYQRLSGFGNRYKIIARSGEYSGFTHMTMALGRLNGTIHSPFEPLASGTRHIPQPYCYRCPLGLEYPSCGVACAGELERVILEEGPELVAALLTTSISQQTTAAIPPPEYWPMIRDICDKYGVLLIDDEVVCGFGRTGKMFGMENFGIVPDIMTVAKSLTSGYLPLGACITSSKISEKFEEKQDVFRNVTTFGGLPGCCAASLANLDIIEDEGLVQNAQDMGLYISERLELLREHPMVGDVRGIGLFWCIEIVKDKKSKEKLTLLEAGNLKAKLKEGGLLTRVDEGIIRFMPPLVISKEEVDEGLSIIDKAISHFEKEMM